MITNWIKKQTVSSWLTISAAVLTFIVLIMHCVNSTTGFYQNQSIDVLPLIFDIIVIVLLAGIVATQGKVSHWIVSLALVVVVVFLSVSLCNLINARTDAAANEWFIPSTSEDATRTASLNLAIVCAVFYILAILATIVVAFIGKFNKATVDAVEEVAS